MTSEKQQNRVQGLPSNSEWSTSLHSPSINTSQVSCKIFQQQTSNAFIGCHNRLVEYKLANHTVSSFFMYYCPHSLQTNRQARMTQNYVDCHAGFPRPGYFFPRASSMSTPVSTDSLSFSRAFFPITSRSFRTVF